MLSREDDLGLFRLGWWSARCVALTLCVCGLTFGVLGCLSPATPKDDISRPDLPADPTQAIPESDPSLTDVPKVMQCSGKLSQPLNATWTTVVGDNKRTFEVHVPATYKADIATPVVLNFHGYASDGAQQDQLSHMSEKADTEGFIAVHPNGYGDPESWNAGGDCCGQASEDHIDDIGFVNAMLDDLESTLCIDPQRVFVTGMSNGAFFTQRVGCELSQRVAAIAPVAGVLVEATCDPVRAVPVMEFHGTLDPVVPYDGDAKVGLPSVPATFAGWADRDGCTETTVVTYSDQDSSCETHETCKDGAEVTLCTVVGGGHTWPGGTPLPWLGYTTPYLSATDEMWIFFMAHPLPPPSTT